MLTPRKLRFAKEYVLDHNGAAAAVRAGYAPNTAKVSASRLMREPEVQAAVRDNERAVEVKIGMSRDKVIQGLLDAIAIAEVEANPHALIAGWREIAKMLGYYTPERQVMDVTLDTARVIRRFEQMSDAELLLHLG